VLADELVAKLAELPLPERVEALNAVRQRLHGASPFVAEPVDCVLWVAGEKVGANDYNPNTVAPPEMALLEHSIQSDGYTQPIVAFAHKDGTYEVVDGFHRSRVGKESKEVKKRLSGYLPLAIINAERSETKDRIAATIRHNRARGVHGIEPMASLVARCYFNGWSNVRICRELGMEMDEVLRLKQFTGLGNLFEHRRYSEAWEPEPVPEDESA
jgi:ParB-like chromosome segregation protein Spo0J